MTVESVTNELTKFRTCKLCGSTEYYAKDMCSKCYHKIYYNRKSNNRKLKEIEFPCDIPWYEKLKRDILEDNVFFENALFYLIIDRIEGEENWEDIINGIIEISLNEKEKDVITKIYKSKFTLKKISHDYGVTSAYIWQVKNKSLKKLSEKLCNVFKYNIILAKKEELEIMLIEKSKLSTRAKNALLCTGMKTFYDIFIFVLNGGFKKTKLKGLGEKCKKEIIFAMNNIDVGFNVA